MKTCLFLTSNLHPTDFTWENFSFFALQSFSYVGILIDWKGQKKPLVSTYIGHESDIFHEFSFLFSVDDFAQTFSSTNLESVYRKITFCCFHPNLNTLKMSNSATVT